MARKRVNGGGGGGRGKQKRETKRGPGFDGRGRARGVSSNISGEGTCARVAVFFLDISFSLSFRPNLFPISLGVPVRCGRSA